MFAVTGSTRRNFVELGGLMVQRRVVALDAGAVECFAAFGMTVGESGNAERVAAQRLKLAMTRLAVAIPRGVNSRERAGRSLLLSGARAQREPGGVSGGDE